MLYVEGLGGTRKRAMLFRLLGKRGMPQNIIMLSKVQPMVTVYFNIACVLHAFTRRSTI